MPSGNPYTVSTFSAVWRSSCGTGIRTGRIPYGGQKVLLSSVPLSGRCPWQPGTVCPAGVLSAVSGHEERTACPHTGQASSDLREFPEQGGSRLPFQVFKALCDPVAGIIIIIYCKNYYFARKQERLFDTKRYRTLSSPRTQDPEGFPACLFVKRTAICFHCRVEIRLPQSHWL